MPKKQTTKRGLENPADLSVSLAPAAPKKPKAQTVSTNSTKTRLAMKQAKENNGTSSTNDQGSDTDLPEILPTSTNVGATKLRTRPKLKSPPDADLVNEPEEDNASNPPATTRKEAGLLQKHTKATTDSEPNTAAAAPLPTKKGKKTDPSKVRATAVEPEAGLEVDEEIQPLLFELKKSSRPKKPSAVAEKGSGKVNKQAATQQNAKDIQAAKKAKKADATVIMESPEDTAAFLAKAKGHSLPVTTSPVLTSPKRKKLTVDRTKAMEQLVNSQAPSPNPSLVLGISNATDTSARTSSIAPDDLVSQVDVPKLKNSTKSSLEVPRSGSTSRNVSPTAPPHLGVPASNAAWRDASPTSESVITADEDYDEEFEASRVDISSLLDGIPKPWNVGPAIMPPALPEPLHTAKLKPEVLHKLSQGGKDKSKPARPTINNFRVQDQAHPKLNLEFMEDLVVNVHAFPDDENRWTFASLSNYWASKKLGRNYRLTRDSEHCRLLFSRISQVRGRLVTATISDGIRDNYDGLAWKSHPNVNKVEAQNSIRKKVTDMIQGSSFLAPDNQPTLYYQNAWFAHIMKQLYWQGPSSKGFAETHASHFSGISYPMLALVVTATEKMLAVVAGGLSAATASHRNATSAFSHKSYAPRFDSHLMTLARLHHSAGGRFLTDYLTKIHQEFRGSHVASTTQRSAPKLAIPLSALDNYGMEPKSQVILKGPPEAPVTLPNPHAPGPSARTGFDLAAILHNSALTDTQKLQIINVIYMTTDETPPSRPYSHSARSSQQYEGLLTEVNEDSDDSETEARRAGALPGTLGRENPTGKIWVPDSDEEMCGGVEGDWEDDAKGGGGSSKAKGVSKRKSKPEAVFEADSEGEIETRSADESMVVLEPGDGREGSSAATGATGDEESGSKEPSDDETAPTKSRELRFFTADGNVPPYDSDDDGESTGEGHSGIIAAQANGDQSMASAVDSDENDE